MSDYLKQLEIAAADPDAGYANFGEPGHSMRWNALAKSILSGRAQHADEVARLRAEVARLQSEKSAVVDVPGRISEWSVRYGTELIPPRGDTYGEGVRDSKDAIRSILAAALSGGAA